MKILIPFLFLCASLCAIPSPTKFFAASNISVLYDTSANFITVISTNTSFDSLDFAIFNHTFNVYRAYTSKYPQRNLQGINWWFKDEINIVFDRFWLNKYFHEFDVTEKTKMLYNKIKKEIKNEI